MSQNEKPLNDLHLIRGRLVSYRRELSALTAQKNANGATLKASHSFAEFITVQGQIDLVDRAIADEEHLVPSVYETHGFVGSERI